MYVIMCMCAIFIYIYEYVYNVCMYICNYIILFYYHKSALIKFSGYG